MDSSNLDLQSRNAGHERAESSDSVYRHITMTRCELCVPVPGRGSSILFQPLEHLQEIKFFRRKDIPILPLGLREFDHDDRRSSLEAAEIQAAIKSGEAALAISVWATVTLCRALSLENVLTIFTRALLERQRVVI